MLKGFNCNVLKSLKGLVDKILENDHKIKYGEVIDEIARKIYLDYLNNKGKDEEVKDHNSIIKSLNNLNNSIKNAKPELKTQIYDKKKY